jgi:hypothetical protein
MISIVKTASLEARVYIYTLVLSRSLYGRSTTLIRCTDPAASPRADDAMGDSFKSGSYSSSASSSSSDHCVEGAYCILSRRPFLNLLLQLLWDILAAERIARTEAVAQLLLHTNNNGSSSCGGTAGPLEIAAVCAAAGDQPLLHFYYCDHYILRSICESVDDSIAVDT